MRLEITRIKNFKVENRIYNISEIEQGLCQHGPAVSDRRSILMYSPE